MAIGAASTTSAANGTYSITGLAAGTSGSLTCTKTGYAWTAISVAAMSGDLTSQNFTGLFYSAGGGAANALATYWVYNAASKNQAMTNIVNPGTYNLTEVGTVPWANNTGFVTASGKYFMTGITPTNQNYTYICRIAAPGTKYQYAFGGGSAALANPSVGIAPRNDSFSWRNGGNVDSAPELAADFAGVIAIAGTKAFVDGVARSGAAAAWSAGTPNEIQLGGAYYGEIHAAFAGQIHYFSVYSSVLSDAQVLAVSAAMNALP